MRKYYLNNYRYRGSKSVYPRFRILQRRYWRPPTGQNENHCQ